MKGWMQYLNAVRVKAEKVRMYYAKALLGVVGGLFSSSALAIVISDTTGPFGGVLCVVTTWLSGMVVPIASIGFVVMGVAFLWGEEITGMAKKWIYGIIALCMAFSGSAIAAWAAVKFGVVAMC